MNVLLTGASSGIGRGLLLEYLRKGAQVYALSRCPPMLPEVGSERGSAFRFQSIDLAGTVDDIQAGTRALLGQLKVLHLAVLNAGTLGHFGDLAGADMQEIERVMRVNVWANKIILDEVFQSVPVVQQVVAISSGAGVSGARGWSAYGISKAALNMLVQLYAAERPETHFSALAPGLVDTAMQEYLRDAPLDEERFPTVARLRRAQDTPDMPSVEAAAPRLVEAFGRVHALPSGSYADLRRL